MKRLLLPALIALTGMLAGGAWVLRADAGNAITGTSEWTCLTGGGTACTAEQLARPELYRQFLVVPTGYELHQKEQFFADAETLRQNMSDVPGSTVYSEVHREFLLYITYWVPGGPLNSETAAFGGKVFTHPIRGVALTMDQEALYSAVDEIHECCIPDLSLSTAITLFNTHEDDITANATPPSYTRRQYGIARVTAGDIQSTYLGMHEVAHAFLSYVDEYVESGFEELNIRQLDVLTPLALWNGSFDSLKQAVRDLLGVYDLNISEILVSGADNVSLRTHPATVPAEDAPGEPEVYEYEGGFFFGLGTFHDRGNNIMNSNRYKVAEDDGFGYDHTESQQRVVDTVFTIGEALRANDRLRASGPLTDWRLSYGASATVMIYDEDKNHRWHPTLRYDVQVGWWSREWTTCDNGNGLTYPCYEDVWHTVERSVEPTEESVELKSSSLFGLASLVQSVVCGLGLGALSPDIDLCTLTVEEMADAFLPTLKFYLPYQTVEVPTFQSLQTYYWRARTWNGTLESGWTAWSSFFRLH